MLNNYVRMESRSRSHAFAISLASFGALLTSLAYITSSLLIYARGIDIHKAFALVGEFRYRPFSDLEWVTVVRECGTNSQDAYKTLAEKCHAYGYGVNGGGYPDTGYPPMVAWLFQLVNFPAEQTSALGVVIGSLMVAILLFASRGLFRSSWAWAIVMSLILMSFPVQSILEKGNIDILVYILITLTAACVAQQTILFSLVAIPFSLLAVSLKIFPIAGFAGWFFFDQFNEVKPDFRIRRSAKYAIFFGSAIGLALSVPWFPVESMFASGDIKSYGLRALGYINLTLIELFGLDMARWMIRGLIATKLIALALGATMVYQSKLDISLQKYILNIRSHWVQRFTFVYTSIMTWAWIGCYILTISYNHRQVFMLPAVIALAGLLEQRDRLSTRQVQVALLGFLLAVIVIFFPIAYVLFLHGSSAFNYSIDLIVECTAIPTLAGMFTSLLASPMFRKICQPSSNPLRI
jgi:hypothetical protein